MALPLVRRDYDGRSGRLRVTRTETMGHRKRGQKVQGPSAQTTYLGTLVTIIHGVCGWHFEEEAGSLDPYYHNCGYKKTDDMHKRVCCS